MHRIWLLLISVIATPALALQTLGVVGAVVPATAYYEQFIVKSHNGKAAIAALDRAQVKAWSGEAVPYDSGLIERPFKPIRFDRPLARLLTPICLVANDAASVDWLKRHRSSLKNSGGVCYLVRSTGPGDLGALEQIVPGMIFVAINPAFVIDRYRVPGYPALISKVGIEQ